MGVKVLRIVIIALVITLVTGGIVLLIGSGNDWTTSVEYSNGFFMAGLILVAIGCVNIIGAHNANPDEGKQYDGEVDAGTGERFKQITRDIGKGYNFLAIFGSAGVLTIGISLLVTQLFK
jgi:hypothetical protein